MTSLSRLAPPVGPLRRTFAPDETPHAPYSQGGSSRTSVSPEKKYFATCREHDFSARIRISSARAGNSSGGRSNRADEWCGKMPIVRHAPPVVRTSATISPYALLW